MVKVKEDLTGKTFGRLVVLEQVEDYISPKGEHEAKWKCQCSCSNHTITYVTGKNLKRKRKPTASCGCLMIEKNRMSKKKRNRIEEKDGYCIGYTSKGEEFYFDIEDKPIVENFCWHINHKRIKHKDGSINDSQYLCTTMKDYNKIDGVKRRGYITLSRLLMKVLDDNAVVVDHKNGNTMDNRKSNLRICTQEKNNYNKGLSAYSSTNIKGVSYHKSIKKFVARIGFKNKRLSLGCFETLYDAAKAYNDKVTELYGEYAYLNDLSEISN